eukprot:scaffold21531_cov63-Phaeocystis_antarctica.AAC.5
MAFSSAEPMQAGVPPCSSHKSTQRKSEVERSGVTRKQVVLTGEGVQSTGQSIAAAGRIIVTITRTITVAMRPILQQLPTVAVLWGG